MRIVCISDTHNRHNSLLIPECDLLIHCGDFTLRGARSEVENFAKWIDKQPAKNIIIVPGNHEKIMEACLTSEEGSSIEWITSQCPRAKVLVHEVIELEGIKFFGSPYTPFFFNWAWNAGRTIVEAAHTFKPFIGDLWKDIPLDTQVLITHGPPMGILDLAKDYRSDNIISVGCAELSNRIKDLKDLKIHAFGHLHSNGGKVVEQDDIRYINAAICDEDYRPTNKIIEVKL